MSHKFDQLIKAAGDITTAESKELLRALSNNNNPQMDAEDLLRLAIYRRAVKAGLYTDRIGRKNIVLYEELKGKRIKGMSEVWA